MKLLFRNQWVFTKRSFYFCSFEKKVPYFCYDQCLQILGDLRAIISFSFSFLIKWACLGVKRKLNERIFKLWLLNHPKSPKMHAFRSCPSPSKFEGSLLPKTNQSKFAYKFWVIQEP
jgi:hypothetical protein